MIKVGKVAMVDIDEIEIGNRAREEMGDLEGLEESMKESGAISPIAVKENKGDKPYFLLAGERRITVLRKHNKGKIPVRVYPSDISDIEVAIIEVAENFHRKDLEWYEYDNKVREIHKLQQELHGEKISTLADAPGWGLRDTADLIGCKSKTTPSMAIKRAEAREAFPELFTKCKTQKDAIKVLSKLNEAVVKDALAKKIEQSQVSPDKQQLANNFILKNFFDGVREIPDNVMHLVEIDPPYSIGLREMKKKDSESSYQLSDYNEVHPSIYMDGDGCDWKGMNTVFKECYRVMTEHSWLICWFAPEPWFSPIHKAILNAGFSTTQMCGIWTKPSGQSQHPEIYLSNSYEMFFYAWKGRPAMASAGRSNVFSASDFPPVSPQLKTHPTERPVDLMKEIYSSFAFPGSRVLIPFLGSGSGLIAAQQLGMSATGFELGKGYRDSFLVKIHKM
jgi:ParB/RepB/Spo0J family partition protein